MTHQKEIIYHHMSETIKWAKSLQRLPEKQWRKPIAPNKWSPAEIIGHFVPWDEFILINRLPFLFTEKPLPSSPTQQKVNDEAAFESRKNSQAVTIKKFIQSRQKLLQAIKDLDNDLWTKELSIGKSTLTLYEYFSGLAKHDLHHFRQIQHANPNTIDWEINR